MRKLIIGLSIIISLAGFKETNTRVYLCDSKGSVAYHDDHGCSWLKRCKHEIITVTIKETVNTFGKRACKFCY